MTSTHSNSDAFMADLRRAYCAEFERTPELQAEFLQAADYAGFKIAQSPEMIRRMCEHYEDTLSEAARQRALRAGLLNSQ